MTMPKGSRLPFPADGKVIVIGLIQELHAPVIARFRRRLLFWKPGQIQAASDIPVNVYGCFVSTHFQDQSEIERIIACASNLPHRGTFDDAESLRDFFSQLFIGVNLLIDPDDDVQDCTKVLPAPRKIYLPAAETLSLGRSVTKPKQKEGESRPQRSRQEVLEAVAAEADLSSIDEEREARKLWFQLGAKHVGMTVQEIVEYIRRVRAAKQPIQSLPKEPVVTTEAELPAAIKPEPMDSPPGAAETSEPSPPRPKRQRKKTPRYIKLKIANFVPVAPPPSTEPPLLRSKRLVIINGHLQLKEQQTSG